MYLSDVLCRFSWLDPDRESVLDDCGGGEVELAVFSGSTAAVDVDDDGGGGEGVDKEAPWDAEKRCEKVRTSPVPSGV